MKTTKTEKIFLVLCGLFLAYHLLVITINELTR